MSNSIELNADALKYAEEICDHASRSKGTAA